MLASARPKQRPTLSQRRSARWRQYRSWNAWSRPVQAGPEFSGKHHVYRSWRQRHLLSRHAHLLSGGQRPESRAAHRHHVRPGGSGRRHRHGLPDQFDPKSTDREEAAEHRTNHRSNVESSGQPDRLDRDLQPGQQHHHHECRRRHRQGRRRQRHRPGRCRQRSPARRGRQRCAVRRRRQRSAGARYRSRSGARTGGSGSSLVCRVHSERDGQPGHRSGVDRHDLHRHRGCGRRQGQRHLLCRQPGRSGR